MKKRHIALVIAGLVVGAAGVAAENLEVLPFSSRDAYAPEAAQFESGPADVAVVEVTAIEVVPVEVVQVESVQIVAVEPVVVAGPKPAMISSIPQWPMTWSGNPCRSRRSISKIARRSSKSRPQHAAIAFRNRLMI